MATAYPYLPDETKDTSNPIPVTSFGEGDYYFKSYIRVPMEVGADTEQIAMFPKTIASQVIESDAQRFVTLAKRDVLDRISFVEGGGSGEVGNIKIKVSSVGDDDVFHQVFTDQKHQSFLNDTFSPLANSVSSIDSRLETVEYIFDGAPDELDNAINKWHELEAFLTNVTEGETLAGKLLDVKNDILGTSSVNGDVVFYNDPIFRGTTKGVETSIMLQNLNTVSGYTNFYIKTSLNFDGEDKIITLPSENGVLALTKHVPYIGFSAPTNPKAGDVWFDIS